MIIIYSVNLYQLTPLNNRTDNAASGNDFCTMDRMGVNFILINIRIKIVHYLQSIQVTVSILGIKSQHT